MPTLDSYPALARHVREVQARLTDPALAELYARCYRNTLDTTVQVLPDGGTYVITGDINAMWLRDSTAQVWHYLPHVTQDPALRDLIAGLVRRQLHCIQLDPYANAFNAEANNAGHRGDLPPFSPWVWERKFELDSLCYPVRLAHALWRLTGDRAALGEDLHAALRTIVAVLRTEQRHETSPYTFERPDAGVSTDTLNHGGRGAPVGFTGMVWAGFRPSDDACTYGYNIPGNMFVAVTLAQVADLARDLGDEALAEDALALQGEVRRGIEQHGVVDHPDFGRVYAYEVDGLGHHLFMDDANVPSLLSAPYLGFCTPDDPLYLNTRRLVLSRANPYYVEGRFARGVGSPHTPVGHVWPIGITMQGLTARDPAERRALVRVLAGTTGGTGWMHESFHPDHPETFTRAWFAWANSLFSELVELSLDD